MQFLYKYYTAVDHLKSSFDKMSARCSRSTNFLVATSQLSNKFICKACLLFYSK